MSNSWPDRCWTFQESSVAPWRERIPDQDEKERPEIVQQNYEAVEREGREGQKEEKQEKEQKEVKEGTRGRYYKQKTPEYDEEHYKQ